MIPSCQPLPRNGLEPTLAALHRDLLILKIELALVIAGQIILLVFA